MLGFLNKPKTVRASELGADAVRRLWGLPNSAKDSAHLFMFDTAMNFKLTAKWGLTMVDPKLVHCSVWERRRLDILLRMGKRKLKEVLAQHPPQLNGYRLRDGSIFYAVSSDGNHRMAAARRRCIRAAPCRVSMFELLPGGAYALGPPFGWRMPEAAGSADVKVVYAWKELRTSLGNETMAKILLARGADEVRFY